MVSWTNLCRSPASNRLNPALQQYYAEETEEFYTNLANGLDNLFVSLGPETVRVEWLELAVSFLRTTHSEVQVLLDKLKHYAPLHSKSDPDWLQTYMEETEKLLDVCTRLKPGIARIGRYQMCVDLASRALSSLNMDAIQAELRRCLYRRQGSGGHAVKTGPDEDPGLGGGYVRKRSPPSRESFEFPVSGSPAMDTSPVMPSSPTFVVDAVRKADRFSPSLEHMNVSSPSKTRDGRADSLARDTAALKAQHVALEQGVGGGEESWDLGLEDLESLVAEAEKLLYMRRPGSLTEPPPPPPGLFDGPVLPPVLLRETGSPLRPFKLDSNFKIDVSPSKSSDSSSSPHSSKRRSSDMKPSPRKPPVYRNSEAKDCSQGSGEAEPGSSRHSRQVSAEAEPSSSRHSRQVSAEAEPSSSRQVSGEAEHGSGKHSRHASAEAEPRSSKHSGQLSTDSSRSGVTLEQVSAPFIAQFEATLTALRECKEELEKEWRLSMESQNLIVDPLQTSSFASRSSLSASFTRYFRQRPSIDSSRRKSSGEGSKLAQFLETLTAERNVEENEARERRDSSDGLNTISASAWVEKGAHSMTGITEGKEGHASESPSLLNVRDVKKVLSTANKRVVDEPVKHPQRRDLQNMKTNGSNQVTTAPDSASRSRWGIFYSSGHSEPAPRMRGGHEKVETAEPVSISLSAKEQTVRRTSGRRRSQSLDEVAIERLHLDNLIVTDVQEREPSPISKQDLLSPRGRSEFKGSHRKSASFDRWKPYTPGGWRSERTEAIMRAYQNRRKALTPSPDSRLEIRASEDGIDAKKKMAGKVERTEVSEGASLLQKFPEEAAGFVGGLGQRTLSESSVSDGQGRGLSRDNTVDMRTAMSHARSIDSHRPSAASTNLRPRPLPEAKHLKPFSVRAGSDNVANIVARFESFFDAEFDAKHDIKTVGRHASRDSAAAFESNMRVYDNPLHRAGPPSVGTAAPVAQRKSASSWRIDATGGFWRRSASRSPSRSLEQDRKGGRRFSMSPRKSRERAKSSSSPGRLNLFNQVRHWVSHHHGEDDETSKLQEASKPSSDLRRSRSSGHSKPTTPSHTMVKSPGRLNLVTIQRGASSLVKNFGSVAMKQCVNPAAGSSRWSGLGGVLLATKASTGVVSAFVVWVLARKEAEIHPSRLFGNYTDTKSDVHGHWASSLQRLQERVAKFDSATRSLLLGVSNANAADSQRPSSSSDHDRRGRRRWSLELKPRKSSSEHHRQDVDDNRSSGSMELGNQRQSGGVDGLSSRRTSIQSQAGISACLHIQELKDVHDYVEELHVGLELLLSSCLSALGKNRGELEQLPQEKIIREYVPSESPSDSAIPRRLFDKGGRDAVSAQEPTLFPMQHRSTSLQVPKESKNSGPAEVAVLSPDSHNSERKSYRRKSTQTAAHQVSYSGSSFSFDMDNGIEEQLKNVEAIFEDWRSGRMAVTMRRLHQCKEEFCGSLGTVSREVDELSTELESGRRSMVD